MYRLGDGFAYCCADGRPIFLDLIRNRYVCLKPTANSAFMKLIEQRDLDCDDNAQLGNLVQLGILSSDMIAAPLARPFLTPASSSVDIDEISGFSGPAMRALLQRFAVSMSLRLRGLDQTIRALKIRKEEVRIQGELHHPDANRQVASAFNATHLLLSANDRCLSHAIALFQSLLAARQLPTLIFGVRMNPFTAHCWVQNREQIFCDSPANVRQFTPIFAI